MKNFITKENIGYRLQQLLILVLHLILLKWMFYTLTHAGMLPMDKVFYHFIGMSIMGALLIRGTAYWARHHYIKNINTPNEESSSHHGTQE